MRKLTGSVFQSLDGVMQAPGGPSSSGMTIAATPLCRHPSPIHDGDR